MTPKVFSYFNRPGSLAGSTNFATALDRTRQEFKDECDISLIMKRFDATGVMPQPWKSAPVASWGDFASVPEYLEAQQLLINAREAFASLSATVRERFRNDPAQLLAFVADKANKDEATRLGLVAQPPAATPAPASPEKG